MKIDVPDSVRGELVEPWTALRQALRTEYRSPQGGQGERGKAGLLKEMTRSEGLTMTANTATKPALGGCPKYGLS